MNRFGKVFLSWFHIKHECIKTHFLPFHSLKTQKLFIKMIHSCPIKPVSFICPPPSLVETDAESHHWFGISPLTSATLPWLARGLNERRELSWFNKQMLISSAQLQALPAWLCVPHGLAALFHFRNPFLFILMPYVFAAVIYSVMSVQGLPNIAWSSLDSHLLQYPETLLYKLFLSDRYRYTQD